jgi:transcriptional regulator EpsA
MDAVAELTQEESGHLARILLAARRVSQRHQFFAWVHGPMQALIPHEILLCGVADELGQWRHEVFSACRYFRDAHFARVCDPAGGLLAELASAWQTDGRARLLAPSADDQARLVELELKNVAYHGVAGLDGRLRGYASFSRVGIAFDARLALYLDLLLPHLVSTLLRVLANEARRAPPSVPSGVLTRREIDVLRWVHEGQTNEEIATKLGLSMLTVKNHLRNAMQKLQVRTRGQAVVRAIALGELK